MSAASEIFRSPQPNISATRFPTNLKKEFDAYMNSKIPFIRELESNLKYNFKIAEEKDELNAFFELNTSEVISSLNDTILASEVFSVVGNEELVTDLLNKISNVLLGNMKNNQVLLKALENIHLIINFFDSLKLKFKEVKEQLAMDEKKFDLVEALQNIKVTLNTAEDICTKMIKSMVKVKKIQITFTVDDEHLSTLIEGIDPSSISLQDVMQFFDSYSAFFERTQEELDYLFEQDLTIQNDDVDSKVRNVASLFIKFFEDPNNHLAKFLAYCYLYRDNVINELAEESSAVVSLLLKKTTSYKTFVFLKYFDDSLNNELSNNIKDIEMCINRILESRNPVKQHEELCSKISKTNNLITFIQTSIVNRKTNTIIFNNTHLNDKIPQTIEKISSAQEKLYFYESELRILKAVIPNYENYLNKTKEMKLINIKSNQIEEKIKMQKILKEFAIETQKFEIIIYEHEDTNSRILLQLKDIIEGNNIIRDEYKSLFLKKPSNSNINWY